MTRFAELVIASCLAWSSSIQYANAFLPAGRPSVSFQVRGSGSVAEAVDLSIPYDAAAQLAYDASDKSVAFDDFKTKFEADAVADVVAKKQAKEGGGKAKAEPEKAEPVDISIPYDAAARLAYDASDKSVAFEGFKTKYEADAVADVIAKQPVDLSIPYDAAARLAYEASDKSVAFADFKSKYEADAVADVAAKNKAELEKAAKAKAGNETKAKAAAEKKAKEEKTKTVVKAKKGKGAKAKAAKDEKEEEVADSKSEKAADPQSEMDSFMAKVHEARSFKTEEEAAALEAKYAAIKDQDERLYTLVNDLTMLDYSDPDDPDNDEEDWVPLDDLYEKWLSQQA